MQGKTVKVGDTVLWSGGFGTDASTPAMVEAMEVTDEPREKYDGDDVDEVDVELIEQNRVLFTLNNGHWAYSDQITVPN